MPFAAAFALLAACRAPGIEATEYGWADAAAVGWSMADLREPETDEPVQVIWASTPADFEERCDANAAGIAEVMICKPKLARTAAACLVRFARGIGNSRGGWLIVLAPGQAAEPNGEPVLHEEMHRRCFDTRVCEGDPYNSDHTDARVWKAVGGDMSAQHFAQEAFLEAHRD